MKKIRKLFPFSIYDISGIEHWLEDAANMGLFPIHFGLWVTFAQTGVSGTRFRLEACDKKSTTPSMEQLELYRSAGWEYALTISNVYYLFYTTDPSAKELYTDLQSRGFSLEKLEKKIRHYRRVHFAIYAVIAVFLIWTLFFFQSKWDVDPAPLKKIPVLLLFLCHPLVLVLLAAGGFSKLQSIRDYRLLRRTCQAFKEGLAPPPSAGPSRQKIREQKIMLALIPILIVTDLLLIGSTRGVFRVPVERFPKAYISLQDLEAEEVELTTYEALFGPSRFYEGENEAVHHLSLLAPTWYEVNQSVYQTGEGDFKGISYDPEGGKYRYHATLDMTYFELTIPAMARMVAESQMEVDRALNRRYTYTELSHPALDFAIYATSKDGILQALAVGKGGHVAVFSYGGMQKLDEHLDLLATMVTEP